jgi:hypothetical protein
VTTLASLAGQGYLPKELPTPFNSRDFGTVIGAGHLTGKDWRPLLSHNLARPGRIYRRVAVPHPLHFAQLATTVANSWIDLSKLIARSPLSLSKPTVDTSARRALVPANGYLDRVLTRAALAPGARYVVECDVSQFYPSIYTHSIEWAIDGKATAKRRLRARGIASPKPLGTLLDEQVRNGQDGQTIGIPIGPDTSLVLGELVMSAIDMSFLGGLTRQQRRSFRGMRYYDDYEFFTASASEASDLVASLQNTLAEFQLAINPYKFQVRELPVSLQEHWASTLRRIYVPHLATSERAALVVLFDEAFRLAPKYPFENVIAYALSQFIPSGFDERHVVHRDNWKLFEALILQTATVEVATLPRVTYLLNWYTERGYPVSQRAVTDTLKSVIQRHATLGHGSEVAWALWAAISHARAVERLNDDFATIIALHARQAGVLPSLQTGSWEPLMTRSSLATSRWLLVYEAYHHGWLPSVSGRDFIRSSPVVGWLRGRDVCFYDDTATIKAPVSLPRPAPRDVKAEITEVLKSLGLVGGYGAQAAEERATYTQEIHEHLDY